MNTVQVLLSLAANLRRNLQQFDVKIHFFKAIKRKNLHEVPPGFKSKGLVCKLKNTLFRLKQSSRAWFERFIKVMITLGYKQSQRDHILFVRHSKTRGVTMLLAYVDDIIITGNDTEEMQNLKGCLLKEFDIKEVGKLNPWYWSSTFKAGMLFY